MESDCLQLPVQTQPIAPALDFDAMPRFGAIWSGSYGSLLKSSLSDRVLLLSRSVRIGFSYWNRFGSLEVFCTSTRSWAIIKTQPICKSMTAWLLAIHLVSAWPSLCHSLSPKVRPYEALAALQFLSLQSFGSPLCCSLVVCHLGKVRGIE